MSDATGYPGGLLELLNVAHGGAFSLLFVNYSLMLGLAGGVAMLWAVDVWRGKRKDPTFRFAMPITVGLLAGGFMNVLSEVQQPGRLVYGYLYGWTYGDTAVIKYGIILLPLLLALSWWLAFQTTDRDALRAAIEARPAWLRPLLRFCTLWSENYDVLEAPGSRRLLLGLLFLLGMFAAAYSGLFLMGEHGVAVWGTPILPLLFIATGLAGGAMLLAVVAPVLHALATGSWRPAARRFRWIALASVGAMAVFWYVFLWWAGNFGSVEHARFMALLSGPLGAVAFWQVALIGLLLPLLVLVLPSGRQFFGCLVAAVTIVWGAYAMRYLVVIGGQRVARSAAGDLAFAPSREVLWNTAFDVLLAVALMVLLAALLPMAPRIGGAAGEARA